MMRLSVLASSSRGNASVISAGGTTLMVDAGISALRIRKGLEECGLSVPSVDGIFLTHEHHDHICGLGVLSKKDKLRLYCSRYLVSDLLYLMQLMQLNQLLIMLRLTMTAVLLQKLLI